MILRILRGHAGQDDLPRLLEAVEADIAAWAVIDAGLHSALPAWQPTENGIEFLLVSTWSDAESVIARGGEVTLPRGRLGSDGVLREGRAQHYELLMGVEQGARAAAATPPVDRILRLSTISLAPRHSSAFYEQVRGLWEALVGDSGLEQLFVGRRLAPGVEHAVVVSVWESAAALEAATSGGLVGGEQMRTYYAAEPVIEQFIPLALQREDALTN